MTKVGSFSGKMRRLQCPHPVMVGKKRIGSQQHNILHPMSSNYRVASESIIQHSIVCVWPWLRTKMTQSCVCQCLYACVRNYALASEKHSRKQHFQHVMLLQSHPGNHVATGHVACGIRDTYVQFVQYVQYVTPVCIHVCSYTHTPTPTPTPTHTHTYIHTRTQPRTRVCTQLILTTTRRSSRILSASHTFGSL